MKRLFLAISITAIMFSVALVTIPSALASEKSKIKRGTKEYVEQMLDNNRKEVLKKYKEKSGKIKELKDQGTSLMDVDIMSSSVTVGQDKTFYYSDGGSKNSP